MGTYHSLDAFGDLLSEILDSVCNGVKVPAPAFGPLFSSVGLGFPSQ